MATTTFKDAATTGLATLATLWNKGDGFKNPQCTGGGCFWMAGNLLHTAIDTMSRLGVKDSYGFASDAIAYFDARIPNRDTPREWSKQYGFWVDDYGWWGIGFLRAHQSADRLGYDADTKAQLSLLAQSCWQALDACWDPSALSWGSGDAKHTVTGGIPNTVGTGELIGRNSVTNSCFWFLSSLLANTVGQQFLDPNADEGGFFGQALTQKILFDPSGLVYERFFGMPTSSYPSWTWLGDQGLFAGASFLNKQSHAEDFNVNQANAFMQATIKDENCNTSNGVLHEGPAPWRDFVCDYACGKGTFMRYLTYLNDDYHSRFPGVSPYDAYIKTNAQAVWKNKNADGHFPFYWDAEAAEPDITFWNYGPTAPVAILHHSGLSAITAGLPYMADDSIE
jgi:hypothetical protein